MNSKSKLVKMEIYNLGCIGPEGITIELDNMLCLVGPNNCGKSTVLRAYELAVGNKQITPEDRCIRCAENDNPKVILYVHIPKGMPNVDEKWKFEENGLLLVKSKWEWDSEGKPMRQTWNPEINDWSSEDKASGLDTVFSSRLPVPFRISALEEPKEEHKRLLTLILQPISDKIKHILEDKESELSKTLSTITSFAKKPINEEIENINKLKEKLNKSHNEIFPKLNLDINIDIGDIKIDLVKQLLENSNIEFYEWSDRIDWNKQGTGSQRALFWAMMQVRSELKAIDDLKSKNKKEINDIKKNLLKLEKERDSLKKEDTKAKKQEEIDKLNQRLSVLEEISCEDMISQQRQELCLPGYMLLIDEPEIALHPNAIRAASKYLYNLSKDQAWQVMLTTHSPQFINPLEDHTTIVRLERNNNCPSPKTYKADTISFSEIEKENLKMLYQFDTNLSEMFFGQYPIIIEGDTEFAAFEYIMQKYPENYPTNQNPIFIRARGKYTAISLIKILKHFKVNFSILHDADYPLRKDGKVNSSWAANKQIFDIINEARKEGLKVIHRISLPCFELAHVTPEMDENNQIIDPVSKDKPWNMLEKIKADSSVEESVKKILDELLDNESQENVFKENISDDLKSRIEEWANNNSIKDKRIFGSLS